MLSLIPQQCRFCGAVSASSGRPSSQHRAFRPSQSRGRPSPHSASPQLFPSVSLSNSSHGPSPHPTALKHGLEIPPGDTARSSGHVPAVLSLTSLGYRSVAGRRRDSAPLLLQTGPGAPRAERAAGRGSQQRLRAAGQPFARQLHVHGECICVGHCKLQRSSLKVSGRYCFDSAAPAAVSARPCPVRPREMPLCGAECRKGPRPSQEKL